MHLQWKYALIVNLAVLIVLVAFYILDDFRAQRELNSLYNTGLENGADFKAITEKTIRPIVVNEIVRWQSFKGDEIASALRGKKEAHDDLSGVLDINVTHGETTAIQAALVPGKGKEALHINLTEEDDFDLERLGAKLYPIEGKYQTAVIVPYQADLIAHTSDRLIFSAELAHHDELNHGKMSEGLRQMFVDRGALRSSVHEIEVVTKERGRRWLVTDTSNGQRYLIWRNEDLLDVHVDNPVGIEKESLIEGYIQVVFEIPEIPRMIHNSRLMHIALLFVMSSLLFIIVNITTTHLVMRPLEQMTQIIRGAESGDTDSLQQSYSSGEIGRVTYSLARMLRQLKGAHSKRIAALEQFAGGVAHEIRNPLNSIGMTAQYLKSIFSQPEVKDEDIEEAKELLEIVDDEIRQLKQISEQFLTLNRPKHLNLEPTQLGELIDRVLAEFALSMKEPKVQVVKNYDAKLPAVALDPVLIRQAVFNLVQNSIQAMSKGGSIYITTRMDENDASPCVVVEIRDTGIGIPEEIQERIFDAYFTTKENEGGIGLGLALAHQIITAHDGEVTMKSKEGMGTAFTIAFPVH
ncbi:MAG: ATP-binding protein [Candidatus Poribacteria bacterium]|nr:ATP-binding protein [Candidatus Poribacteria bacterium]MDE0504711.1 ATP-binding protein [Candidatus Poribacteria bacterium]